MQSQYSANSGSWNRGLISTSEDCLYLNVWTPAASASERLPVMVWIYGGGGTHGSSAEPIYDGNELTRESEHHSSGNYGSLDQLAAIKWVKNNIVRFGGDPDKITLWGESGGSRSVNFLAASPLLKEYARAAVAESHTSFGRMTTLAEAESTGVAFTKAAGKNSVADLRAMSAADLIAVFEKKQAGLNAAIVDGWFLADDIYTIYSRGKQNDLALITGGTNDEGGNLGAGSGAGRGGSPDTLAKYREWARQNFGELSARLLALYPAATDPEAVKAYHDVNRDINYAGHRTWAKLQATTGKAPVFIYDFSHIPPHPLGNGNNPAAGNGATHFSEVIYVFNNLRMKDSPWTDSDSAVADKMATWWSNFARNGTPNGAGIENWPVYNPKDEFWLNIGDPVRVERFNSAGIDLIAAVQERIRMQK